MNSYPGDHWFLYRIRSHGNFWFKKNEQQILPTAIVDPADLCWTTTRQTKAEKFSNIAARNVNSAIIAKTAKQEFLLHFHSPNDASKPPIRQSNRAAARQPRGERQGSLIPPPPRTILSAKGKVEAIKRKSTWTGHRRNSLLLSSINDDNAFIVL